MAQREQANVPLLLTIGAVSGFLLIVLVIGVQAWFLYEVKTEVTHKWDNTKTQPITDMRLDQQMKINSYRWVDRDKNRVAIPIDEAMKLIVQNASQNTAKPTAQNAK